MKYESNTKSSKEDNPVNKFNPDTGSEYEAEVVSTHEKLVEEGTRIVKSDRQLYKHQQEILRLNPKRHLLAHGTGTGKTISCLELANLNRVPCLIITPKALIKTWERSAAEYKNTQHRIITKEQFRKLWNELPKYNGIIIDEAHYFSGMKSQMVKNLLKYLKKHDVPYRWLATATPYLSTPWNIYILATILGKKINYASFQAEYFYHVNMGGRLVPVARKDKGESLKALIKEIGSTVALEDCVDMPEQTFITEYFSLTDDQQSAIDTLEDINFIARWTKIHQICGGSLKGNEYEDSRTFESEKIEKIKEYALEFPRLIIVSRYNCEINALKSELSSDYHVKVINGDVSGKDRDAILQDFKTRASYILLVNAACSEGWELPSCSTMVFYSHDFSLKNYVQMKGRLQRINNIKKNLYISLVVKDTIDEDVYECLQRKQDFQLDLYKPVRSK